jgi:signal transduction histidine kinase
MTVLRVALAVLAVVIALAMIDTLHKQLQVSSVIIVPLAALIGAPVGLLVSHPLTAWRIAWGVMIVTAPVGMAPPTAPWAWHPVQLWVLMAALLAVALRAARPTALWAWGLTVVVLAFFVRPNALPGLILAATAASLVGGLIRSRREVQRALAAQERRSEAELARLALLEERQRIARELHDVVAHHMSLVAVRAETAQFRLADVSEPAREEFASLATTAREALTELRRLLGVLRNEHAELARMPQPGLRDIDELVDSVRASGVTVVLDKAGVLEPVSDAVGLSTYRILQEALSNARRHAPGAGVRVEVRGSDRELSVLVVNGPPRRPIAVPATRSAAAGGEEPERHGLVGMRERVAMLGGTVTAGPTPEGGYRLHAVLPRG